MSANLFRDGDPALNFNRHRKRQCRHAHCRAGMGAALAAIEGENQVGTAIDYGGLLGKISRAVDHAMQMQPGAHTIKIAQLERQ